MTPDRPEAPSPADEAEADLTPFLPELTEGLAALQRFPEPYLDLLAAAGLGAGARVLDVACGRGAAAIALAVRLGAEVEGVDELAPFVAAAEAEARRRGLPCRFRVGDVTAALDLAGGRPFDALLCLGLGRPFGALAETVARLRAAVRPGGLLLLEDGHLVEGASISLPEFSTYGDRAAALAGLCAHGDLVVGEWIAPKEEVCAQNAADLDGLRARAEALAARRPALRAPLNLWLGGQAMQARHLEATFQPAAWLLRRGGR